MDFELIESKWERLSPSGKVQSCRPLSLIVDVQVKLKASFKVTETVDLQQRLVSTQNAGSLIEKCGLWRREWTWTTKRGIPNACHMWINNSKASLFWKISELILDLKRNYFDSLFRSREAQGR